MKQITVTAAETPENLDRFAEWLVDRCATNPFVEFDQIGIEIKDVDDE